MCGFHGVQRGNFFGGVPTRITQVEVRVGNLENRKATGKDKSCADGHHERSARH